MVVMKGVIHFGPSRSRGGMATVIENLVKNPPEGWFARAISTHGETLLSVIFRWFKSRRELFSLIKSGDLDLVHIHVTHSMSWWRKIGIMKICEKNGIPTVIHIHSGKFDTFCSNVAGKSVINHLSKPNRKTIILEERWVEKLKKWIPEDSVVVNNSSKPLADRKGHLREGEIKLLLLSRKSSIKGQKFAIEVLERLRTRGISASLTMTGMDAKKKDSSNGVKFLGWVTDEEKEELVLRSDFLLSPSYYEGSSMSIIESMVSGLPCIVSKASEETVGVTDLVIENFSSSDWAERIIRLSDEEEYPKCVEKIIKVSRKYSIEENNKKIRQIYQKLIS
jgi:glycosyltransferase involved in cell wall biosynthesis